MENPTKSQTILISTIIFYLIIFTSGDKIALPIIVDVFTVLTGLMGGDHSMPTIIYGVFPLVAILILIMATSERIKRKNIFYYLSVFMLCPSVWATLKQNMSVNKFGLTTFSILPFAIISMFGFSYFTWKWIKRHRNEL
jgi:hypothetical protein